MSDLARAANQSQSRLSHTVARLEDRGWVRRERAADDGRGQFAVLTDDGPAVGCPVAPGHGEAGRSAMFDPLTPDQVRVLGEAMHAVVERLDPDRSLRVDFEAPADEQQ